MRLWVGLGNPEPRMRHNRHNIGFMAVEAIAARHGFSPWRARFAGRLAEGSLGGERILLLEPLTYMNASGESVAAAARFYKLPPEAVTVFHDDLDLAPGRVRVKRGGSAAGHNGLRSIDQHLGTDQYWRVRLGIGHPGSRERVVGYVLGDFTPADTWLAPLLESVAEHAPLLASGRADLFMNRLAQDRPENRPDPAKEQV
jgi:PTH1 family peptidyl-tRNA hydrolase